MVPQDPTQFAALVRDHHAMVYRLCYRRLRHHEDAVDATQQVFIKLFAKGDTVHTAVGPWLRQTAINTAISHLRSEITRRRHERTYEPAEPPRARGPMEHDELKRLVRQCLATLEPRDREAAERHLMIGEPQSSIAADWGVTQQAVGKRIRRVKDQLHRHLQRVGVTSLGAGIAAMLPTRLVSAGVARAIGLMVGLKPSHGLVPAAAVALLAPAAQAPDRPANSTPTAADASATPSIAAAIDRSPARFAADTPTPMHAILAPPPRTIHATAGGSRPPAASFGAGTPFTTTSTAPRLGRMPIALPPTHRPPPANVALPGSPPATVASADPDRGTDTTRPAARRPRPRLDPLPQTQAPAPAPAASPVVDTVDPSERTTPPDTQPGLGVLPGWLASTVDPAPPKLVRATVAIKADARARKIAFLVDRRVVAARWAATLAPDRAIARDDRLAVSTGQEAPPMFPLHLREILRTPLLAAVSALPAATAIAGTTVVDPDDDAYAALLDNSAYDSVGMITAGNSLGSGVYLGDGWVLTAAHVADASGDLTFTVDGVDYGVSDVYLHDDWTGDLTTGTDLALIQLDADPAIEAAVIYEPTVTDPVSDKDALDGAVVTFVGYGRTGDGATGATGSAGEKHAGQNTLDAFGGDNLQLLGYDDSLFFVDFDDPNATSDGLRWSDDEALALEYLIAPGDSGGGAFVEIDGVTYLVGINSFLAATDGEADADYGDLGGLVYVPDYYDWVFGITGALDTDLDGLAGVASIPEPGLAASMVLLAAALGLCRRRQPATPALTNR